MDTSNNRKDFLANFGSVVKDQRKLLGISQEELAHRSGLHRTYVTDIERGTRNLSIDSISKLARALDVPLASLFVTMEKKALSAQTQPMPAVKVELHSPRSADILLVEDNPKHIELTLHALSKNGLTNPVTPVESGEEALEILFSRDTLPLLVLLDLSLKKVSGLDVLRKIRSDSRTRSIPVIILTASRSDDDYAAIMELGVTAYISKPIDFLEFSTLIPKIGLSWQLVEQSKASL